METFNLKAALSGTAVVTKDGRHVTGIRVIHSNPKTINDILDTTDSSLFNQGVVATIHNEKFSDEYPFWHDGTASKYGGQCEADLFMADNKEQ